jgi:hypothetical protein
MADGNNTNFSRDPIAFCKRKCVNIQNTQASIKVFDARLAYADAFIDLVPWGNNQVVFTPKGSLVWTGKSTILKGYYFPYIAYGDLTSTGHAAKPLKDIPKNNPKHKFIFTGGVNGCSPMLLKGDDDRTVWGFHYPNSDGKEKGYPLLKMIGKSSSDIIIALDFDLYGTGTDPNGFAFFYFENGKWVGVVQSHKQGAPDMKSRINSMSINTQKGDSGVTVVRP